MADARYAFTLPENPALRWLVDPGRHVSAETGVILLGELLASPKAVLAGVANGLLLSIVALCMHAGNIFAIFILADVAVTAVRMIWMISILKAASRSQPAPTDLYLVTAMLWAALQGAVAFTAMRAGNTSLQVLSAITITGLVGPLCARNYPAPRYAVTLVALCSMPMVAGAALSGNPWLLVPLLQWPMLLFAVLKIIGRFNAMAAATLRAEEESHNRARHDALTGLLNRFGLMETLDARYAAPASPFILFYLDLDGFKPINDNFGHQAGDAILQAVSDRLRSAIRDGDVVSRLGGDEFVIVAPGMSPADGADYARAIIGRVADQPYRLDGIEALRIGISVGYACAPEDGLGANDLHCKADAALYEAKAAGKGVQRRFTGLKRQPSEPPSRVLETACER